MSDSGQRPGCLGAVFGFFVRGSVRDAAQAEESVEVLPYRVRDDFLSPAERSFFQVVLVAAGKDFAVFPKVNLADIFFVSRPNENSGARARISQKHVDFLLCSPGSISPVLGIELDDASHARADRQQRDEFVDAVFEAAGLPLERVPAQASYSVQGLSEVLSRHASGGDAVGQVSIRESQDPGGPVAATPTCGKCGIPMVLRTAGRGANAGGQFYGCTNYPRCRETVALE